MATIKTGVTELRHLRYFLAVADAGHFRRAAEALHLSQPTLSNQIQQLELQMGAPVFDRRTKPVRLTVAGELLRERAMAMMRELEAARESIAELRGLRRGNLRVGIVATVDVSVLPEAVKRFNTSYPKVSVSVRELPNSALETEVRSGELDLGVGFVHARIHAALEMEPLFEECLVAVIPAGHPLHRRRKLTLAEMLEHPLVMLTSGFCTRELVDETIVGLQLGAVLCPTIELNSIEGVLSTVRNTGMATILPGGAVAWSSYPEFHVISLPESGNLSSRRVGLLWLRGGHRSAAACAFAAEIKSALSQGCLRDRAPFDKKKK